MNTSHALQILLNDIQHRSRQEISLHKAKVTTPVLVTCEKYLASVPHAYQVSAVIQIKRADGVFITYPMKCVVSPITDKVLLRHYVVGADPVDNP